MQTAAIRRAAAAAPAPAAAAAAAAAPAPAAAYVARLGKNRNTAYKNRTEIRSETKSNVFRSVQNNILQDDGRSYLGIRTMASSVQT